MPTARETILIALTEELRSLNGVQVLRGEVVPERIPAAGMIILRDGQPGEPEVTLSPLMYHYTHRAELEVLVQAVDDRDARFDRLVAQIGALVVANRTLHGLCDWVEASAPAPLDLPVEGASPIKAAILPVTLNYVTGDPLQ